MTKKDQEIKHRDKSKAKINEIAKVKQKDLNALNLEGAVRIIEGTARSMGIDVE